MDVLRKKIDKIDEQILKLLKKRVDVVEKIGKYKKNNNIPIKDVKREKEVIEVLVKKAKEYGLSKDIIQKIWRNIFDYSYKVEK